jgi:hypothetical protein
MSLVEYAVHRWVMHHPLIGRDGIFERHATLHHGHYFPPGRFLGPAWEDRAAKYISITFSAPEHLFAALPIITLLCYTRPLGAAVFTAVVVIHAIAWSAVHQEMHFPRSRWFAASPLFCYLREYHERHHNKPTTNFNAVLPPLGDWLFGTLAPKKGGAA